MEFMSRFSFDRYRLMAPGPVALSEKVREALALPMIHHRTPLFEGELVACLTKLSWFFQTKQPVMILTSAGSGAMEAALTNTLSAGDKIVAVVSGKFGERWSKMASDFGLNVVEMKVPWGEAVDLQALDEIVSHHADLKALLTQACETSTATLHPVQEIAKLVRSYSDDALIMVDAITAIGCTPLPMDAWDLDVVVAGSQKVFGLPTGLSFIALSERAWRKQKESKLTQFYFDLAKEHSANLKRQTRLSSSVSLIRALKVALEEFEEMGLLPLQELVFKRARAVSESTQLLGFDLFSKSPSPSVTALCVPAGIDGKKWRRHLEEKYQITVMGGQDHFEGKILRIGHMGAIDREDHLALIEALALSYNDLIVLTEPGSQVWHKISDEKVEQALAHASLIFGDEV